MAAERLTDLPRATDSNSDPLSGAQWFFYATGTLTPQSVYTTSALSVAHPNPVVADAGGQFAPIYFDASLEYRGILKDADGTTIRDIDPINAGTVSNLLADFASTASGKGAALLGFKSRATGAIARTVQGRLDDTVSLFEFITPSLHSDILDGTSTTDVSAAIQSAIDSGENIFIPGAGAARYIIDGQIQISDNYQKLIGEGARLDFRGTDSSKNAIEILSTRRDTGSTSATRSLQEVAGFRILGATNSSYASIFFIEEGVTFPYVHDILSEAGTNRGYFGTLADSFMRINGNSTSYVNSPIIERVITHALTQAGVAGDYPPVGFWVEGAIEGRLYGCEAFYYDECFRLGDSTGTSRNVQNMRFIHCHAEPTKPADPVDGQDAIRIFAAFESRFDSCVIKPSNAAGTSNSRGVSFGAGSDGARNVSFQNCDFQGLGYADYAFEVESGASAYGVKVLSGTLNDFALGRVLNSGGQCQIDFDESVTYNRLVPKRERMQARRESFAGLTVTSGAANNSTTTDTLSDIYLPEGTPALAAPDVSSNFCFFEPYRISTEGTWKVKAYQQTGANRVIASGNIGFRPFKPDEILAQSSFSVDYASLASAAASSASYTVPGARLGLPVIATFYDGSVTGQGGVILEAYATADNTVEVLRFNAHSAAVDLGAGTLTISVIQPKFDLSAGVTYDISAVAAGARASTSVTVTGVELGDQCLAWYSADQESCIIRPRLTSAGTVNFEIINPSGVTPTGGASNKIYVGVYRNPMVI